MHQPAGASAALPTSTSIRHLPVNLFASIMGIAGLSMAWQAAHKVFGAGALVAQASGILALAVFVALLAGYLCKAARHPDAVLAEFRHPVSGNFFGSIAIATLLVSSIAGRYSAPLQQLLWTVGAVLTFAIGYIVVARVLKGNVVDADVAPPWLIPGVATLDIAVTGATLPMPWAHEVNLAGAAIGAVVALLFYTLIVARLVLRAPLPLAATPSLMVLVAPFAVGFLAYASFNGVDRFAGLLFYFALFIFAVTAVRVFRPSVPFSTGWWAISFPLAALASAALVYLAAVQVAFVSAIAVAMLALLTIAIAVLTVRTLHILFNGTLLGG
ncbi:SLAC1 anion channel family protein [Massilia sp. HP4]|uniref:SLAC1 anion channel family protein n=1 Tax=Massilia sp. HP4 TaxID=2562316 RepID=UPI0010BF8E37|nr:SLAC1 anion channel family protein [Massilia sp. HP4]